MQVVARNRNDLKRNQKSIHELDFDKDEDIVSFVYNEWDKREQRFGGLYRTWLKTIAAYQGFFNLEYDVALKKYKDLTTEVPPWRVNLAINLLLPRIRTYVAKLLRTRPIFDVLPASSFVEDMDTAFVGKRALQGHWYANDFNLKFIDLLYWLALTGNAYSNPYWDPFSGQVIEVSPQEFINQQNLEQAIQSGDPLQLEAVAQDAQDEYDRFVKKNKGPELFLGNLKWNIPTPFDVISDDVKDDDEISWLIHGTVRPISFYSHLDLDVDLDELWRANKKDQKYMNLSRRINMLSIFDSHELALPMEDGCTDETLELHLWLPASQRHKKGYFAVVTGGKVLRKGPNPYDHGQIPVIHIVAEKVPGKSQGFSSGAQALPEIELYNKSKSMIVEAGEMMSGNKWIVPRTAKIQVINNEVGQMIEFSGALPPTPVAMPNIPRTNFDIMMSNIRDIDEITAQRESTRGQNPAGGRSAALASNLQAADDSTMSIVGLYLDTMMGRTGRLMLSTIGQFVSEDRLISYVGEHNRHVSFVLRAGALRGKYYGKPGADYYNVRVTTFTQFGLDRSGQMESLNILLQYGVFKPEDRPKILKWVEMGWFEDEIDDRKRDRSVAHRENMMMMNGQVIQPSLEQNHEAHTEEHLTFMNGDEYRQLHPQLQTNYRLHILMHQYLTVEALTRPAVYSQVAQLNLLGEVKKLFGADLVALGAMTNGGRKSESESKPAK